MFLRGYKPKLRERWKRGRKFLYNPALQSKHNLLRGFPHQFHYHEIKNEGLDLIQQFLEDRPGLLNDVDFVTRRGLLQKIMDGRTGFQFFASRRDDIIYMGIDNNQMPFPTQATTYPDQIFFSALRFEQCIFGGKLRDIFAPQSPLLMRRITF